MGNLLSKDSSNRDFEKILTDLESKIKLLESSISSYRRSEKRILHALYVYGSIIYLILFGYFFVTFEATAVTIIKYSLCIIAFPVMLYTLKRLLFFYYNKRIERAENKLEQFRLQQKTKVEELKTRTKYYQMKGLIEKFDPEIKVQKQQAEYERERVNANAGNASKKEMRDGIASSPSPSSTLNGNKTMIQQGNKSQNYHYPSRQQSSWFDRIMDNIIGDDRVNKYALICHQCYAHNGLVRAEDYSEIVYKCSQCNFINSNKRVINGENEMMIIKEHPITCNEEQEKEQENKGKDKDKIKMKLDQQQQQKDAMKLEKGEQSPSTPISSSSSKTRVSNAIIETMVVETPSSSFSSSSLRKKKSSKK